MSASGIFSENIFFGSGIDFLLNVVLQNSDYCKDVQDKEHHTIKTIMNFVLEILNQLIDAAKEDPMFPAAKFKTFFSNASGYLSFKDRIIEIANKLGIFKYDETSEENTHTKESFSITLIDSFNEHLQNLLKQKAEFKELNVKVLTDYIADHPNSKEIITELIRYLKKDTDKLNVQEVKFILKILRVYITRENKTDTSPITEWKEISLGDLKKIRSIQGFYLSLGLTEILFNLFSIKDEGVFKEVLNLSMAFLYGGNDKVQESYYENLIKDDENKVIELITTKLQSNWKIFMYRETERYKELYFSAQKTPQNS